MATRTARAALLGASGAALMGAAAWWLLRTAAALWPGSGAVQVDVGMGFLVLGAAGVVAGWAALLLAVAAASLVRPAGWPGHGGRGARSATGPGRGLTGRVAAGLLVAASLGVAPATAAEWPRPVAATSSHVTAATPVDPSAATVTEVPAQPAGDAEDPGDASDEPPVPGWTPTIPAPEPAAHASGEVSLVSTAARTPAEDEVVVHRGDTLWDIAARHLGEHATDQDVAEAWPRWYAANRDVIGSDPDLIHPGQRLVVPAPGTA